MKKIMALAAIALMASTRAHALVGLEGLSWDGSLEVSGFSANNEADSNDAPNDHRGGANTRVRVGVNADVTENVKGRLEFTRTGRQYGTGATTLQNEQDLIRVQNAFVDINGLWGFNARLGRQYVGNPGDLVWRVGPFEDDAMSVNAIDGLLVGRSWDFIGFDAFTGKATEDETSVADTDANDAAGAGDVNVSAVHAWLPTILPGGKIWLGWINGTDLNSSSSSDDNRLNIARVGANGGVMENLLTYRAEFLKDFGQDRSSGTKVKYEGSALDLGLGLNVPENKVGAIGVAVDYTWTSGDDSADNKDKSFRDLNAVNLQASDRYYGEIWGKSNAFNGGSPAGQGLDLGAQSGGYQIIHGAVSLKPAFSTKSWWRLDYFNLGADKGDDYGDEWDLTAGYKHTDNVGFEAGYAMFNANDAVKKVRLGNDDSSTKLFGKVKIKWGGSAS